MPRYFFNLHDGREILDEDGTELSGLDEARAQAVVALGEMLKDVNGRFWREPEWRMWVADEVGEAVCSLTVAGV